MTTLFESPDFLVSGASLPGREHRRTYRNNQDGWAVRRLNDGGWVAVVTDGCSSGAHSEVGARWAAGWLAEAAAALHHLESPALGDALTCWLCAELERWAGGSARPRHETLAQHFLFTAWIALIDAHDARLLGVGDGVWAINGAWQVVDPGPKNAPAYPAYRLLGLDPDDRARVREVGRVPTRELQSLLIATDGAAELAGPELETWLEGEGYQRSPLSLQRRLVVLAEQERRLADDTTAVLVRRRP